MEGTTAQGSRHGHGLRCPLWHLWEHWDEEQGHWSLSGLRFLQEARWLHWQDLSWEGDVRAEGERKDEFVGRAAERGERNYPAPMGWTDSY